MTVERLVKHYNSLLAIDHLDLEIKMGEVFALLGPNGAGKTTTVEILEGFRARDSGSVQVLGLDPSDRAVLPFLRRRIGVVLQDLAVEPYLTVKEVLVRSAAYFPNPRNVDEVVEEIGLADKASSRIKTLSGGQRRRLDLGLGIVGNPELLFLDEPTTGFDPASRREAWNVLKRLVKEGTTVLLTTHYLDEAEALADRLAIISHGRIVAEGTPSTIGGREASEAVIRFRRYGDVFDDGLISRLASDSRVVRGPEFVELHTKDEVRVLNNLTAWALEAEMPLSGLTVQRMTLEDIYLRLVSEAQETANRVSNLASFSQAERP